MASREPGHREAPLPRSWASLSQDALAKVFVTIQSLCTCKIGLGSKGA